MKVGVVLLGLTNIDERRGTFDLDFYLYEHWQSTRGFTPQTEIANELERRNVQFDHVEHVGDRCLRSRRIRSTLRCDYNLRRFPFDTQSLDLVLSDDQFSSTFLTYSPSPYTLGIDETVRRVPSGWKLDQEPSFSREQKPFRWEPGAPSYDYARVSLGVRRHVSYHLTKYFLPLFVIVLVAFSVFWIDPEDLSSQVGVGVTCLLAAIALQFTEGSTLPEVSYLTLADRVYAACYLAIAMALSQSVWGNALVRKGNKPKALVLDRRCRWLFPVCLIGAIAFAALRSFTQQS